MFRLYSSPLEILSGFDVDSCAVGYDGSKVWISQRCHLALINQSNPVNLTRRSLTYEMRLAKYAQRGFEVPVPELVRARLDPTLFERQWHKVRIINTSIYSCPSRTFTLQLQTSGNFRLKV